VAIEHGQLAVERVDHLRSDDDLLAGGLGQRRLRKPGTALRCQQH
jgi:hypothetical protein